MQQKLEKLYKNCVEVWGERTQLRQTQEECAELIVAINHFCRNRENGLDKIIEEAADVYLMVHQVMEIVGKDLVMDMVNYKADRTINLLDKEND